MNGIDIEAKRREKNKKRSRVKSRDRISNREICTRGNNTTSRERRVIFFDGGLSCFRQPFSQIISTLFPSSSSSKMSGRVVSAHTHFNREKTTVQKFVWLEHFLQMKKHVGYGRGGHKVQLIIRQLSKKRGRHEHDDHRGTHNPFSRVSFSF